MKPINCPLEKRKHKFYLRFVNKDTLEYVDMPRARGQDVNIFCDLLKNADCYSDNYSRFYGDKDKPTEYHYMILITLDEHGEFLNNEPPVGFFMRRGKLFRANINQETNEITYAEDIQEWQDKDGVEFTTVGFKKEGDTWYKTKILYVSTGSGIHKERIVSKRKTTYDKIFCLR